ncbi:MAG TPA: CDP-diacylglycerol diphosphatase [Kaistia sp.]|nr:CDP-diacylglycerol diphosphatase [Kaistia sp.]
MTAFAMLAITLSPGPAHSEDMTVSACPTLNTLSGKPDPDHWVSPPEANKDDKAPHACNPCADPANLGSKTCAVYRFLTSEACASGRCADSQGDFVFHPDVGRGVILQFDTRYQHPERHPSARGENCRFIMWSMEPVIGVEDANAYAPRNDWLTAYRVSQTLVAPPFGRDDLALAIQPPTTRGQHQFHIHIGTLLPEYRDALAGLDPAATRLRVNGYDFHVRFLPVEPGKTPFEGVDVFRIVRDMLPGGAADLPRYGVLAAVTEGGSGIWIMAAERFDRSQLNYRQPAACRLL